MKGSLLGSVIGSVFSFEKAESSRESIKGIRITERRERERETLLFQYLSLFVEREKESKSRKGGSNGELITKKYQQTPLPINPIFHYLPTAEDRHFCGHRKNNPPLIIRFESDLFVFLKVPKF